jgi:HAD superfamily hydrolase (TIGR01509 family)
VPRAVIFDMDGTLIDTVDLHARSWHETFQAFGVEASYADVRSQIGKGGDQLLPVFFSEPMLSEKRDALEAHRARLFKERYLPEAKAFPGVRALFERLRRDGFTLAVGSSCKAEELEAFTDLAGVTDLVDVSATSDDAEHSKPCPDIFRAVIEKLPGAEAGDCVVVGDSPFDAQAATAAGVHSIGVLCGGFPEADLRAAGACEIYDSPQDLLSRLAESRLLSSSGV